MTRARLPPSTEGLVSNAVEDDKGMYDESLTGSGIYCAMKNSRGIMRVPKVPARNAVSGMQCPSMSDPNLVPEVLCFSVFSVFVFVSFLITSVYSSIQPIVILVLPPRTRKCILEATKDSKDTVAQRRPVGAPLALGRVLFSPLPPLLLSLASLFFFAVIHAVGHVLVAEVALIAVPALSSRPGAVVGSVTCCGASAAVRGLAVSSWVHAGMC